ncbi:MAG: hypothetical protein RL095_1259 [Verrucomicrobiota bacterium]|jgi:hypothetical protein
MIHTEKDNPCLLPPNPSRLLHREFTEEHIVACVRLLACVEEKISMPATLSHAAFALLLPRRISISARIAFACGSVAPDLPYAAAAWEAARWSHSPLGGILLAWPLALLLTLLIGLAAPSFLSGLPPAWRMRAPQRPGTRREWLAIFVFAGLGVAAHSGLDAFTHSEGAMVDLLPFLSCGPWPLHKALQYGLSLLGVLLLLGAARTRPWPQVSDFIPWLWLFSLPLWPLPLLQSLSLAPWLVLLQLTVSGIRNAGRARSGDRDPH